jgi:hypothetical protein
MSHKCLKKSLTQNFISAIYSGKVTFFNFNLAPVSIHYKCLLIHVGIKGT